MHILLRKNDHFWPPKSLPKSLRKLFHFFEIDVHTRVLTGPPGCQLSIPKHIPMIWTDFWENSTFFKKSVFWSFLVDLGNFSIFMWKCGFVLKIWPNRVWERKKWFEKVVSHYYHVFLSCIGRKIEIDEKVFFFHIFLPFSLLVTLKGSRNGKKSKFPKIDFPQNPVWASATV